MLCSTTTMSPNSSSCFMIHDRTKLQDESSFYDIDKMSSQSSDDSVSSTSIFSSDEIEREDLDNSHECLFPIPSKDVLQHIVQQVESYFTDENLIRDEFLVKNIRRNKQGYVNITLVASLRRVKAITKFHPEPWRLIAYAIDMASNKLELNPNGTKIRRKVSLAPIDDNNKYNRTVILVGLPKEKANVDLIFNDFSMFGLIHSVRIFDSKTFYPSHNKLFKYIDRESLKNIEENETIGSVEFNFKSDAKKCYKSFRSLIHHDPVWSQVQLYLLNNDDRQCY